MQQNQAQQTAPNALQVLSLVYCQALATSITRARISSAVAMGRTGDTCPRLHSGRGTQAEAKRMI